MLLAIAQTFLLYVFIALCFYAASFVHEKYGDYRDNNERMMTALLWLPRLAACLWDRNL